MTLLSVRVCLVARSVRDRVADIVDAIEDIMDVSHIIRRGSLKRMFEYNK